MSPINLSIDPSIALAAKLESSAEEDIHGTPDTTNKLTTDQIALMEPDFTVTPSATRTAAQALDLDPVADVVPEIAGSHNFDTTKGGRVGVASKRLATEVLPPVATDKPFSVQGTSFGPQQTIGGSDLSVFFITEMADLEDMNDPQLVDKPELWRKDLIVLELDNVLSLSYSTVRERFPVRVLGKSHPVAFTRGPRTVAGHIAFAVFTNDVLGRLRSQVKLKFERLRAGLDRAWKSIENQSESMQYNGADYLSDKQILLAKQQRMYEMALDVDKVMLLDQLPPFHLLCMGVNEQGTFSKFMIRNVRIIDENQYQGTTQPNIVNKASWVAEDIVPMTTFTRESTYVTESLGSITENFSHTGYSSTTSYNVLTGTNLLEQVSKDTKKDYIGD